MCRDLLTDSGYLFTFFDFTSPRRTPGFPGTVWVSQNQDKKTSSSTCEHTATDKENKRMKKPACAQVRDVERQGQPADAENVARYMIEIDEYSNHATAKETQAPKRKCPSSERSTKKISSGVIFIFSAFP
ncbi:MAG: hypothetical protein ACM3PB_00885 [Betaproteobacteria bacterium]